MRGLTVMGRRAMVALAIGGLGTGLVAGCAGTGHADKPETAASVSVSPAARHVSSPPAPSRHHESHAAARHRLLPGVYLGWGDGPWDGPKVRPYSFGLGADWAIQKVRWYDWTRQHADGRGYEVGCAGAAGPCQKYWVTILATRVRKRHGVRYFAIMRLTRVRGFVSWLVMDRFGGWQERPRP
jgi:hypothetical protein